MTFKAEAAQKTKVPLLDSYYICLYCNTSSQNLDFMVQLLGEAREEVKVVSDKLLVEQELNIALQEEVAVLRRDLSDRRQTVNRTLLVQLYRLIPHSSLKLNHPLKLSATFAKGTLLRLLQCESERLQLALKQTY